MKIKKQISLLLAAVMLIAALTGCGSKSEPSANNPVRTPDTQKTDTNTPTNTPDEYEAVTIDNFDRTVEFTKKPERVVVLTLNSAEILAALGEADAIVGIARNANTVEDVLPEYYDALKDRDFPEAINSGVPTLEGMLGMEPDLVIANSYYFNAAQIFGSMEDYQANGVEFYITEGSYVPNCTIENTYNDIRNIGAIFGKQAEAEELITGMKERLSAVAGVVEGVEPGKVMSFDSFNEDGFFIAGGVGLAQNLIELAGCINVFSDVERQFANVNIEEIIARNPEVIIIHAYSYMGEADTQAKIDKLMNTEELSEVPAVQNNNIVVVPLFQVNPSLQNVNYVETLAMAMYPDRFIG